MGARQEPVGLLLVDKPAGVSSHDVVGAVRRAVRHRRVGHAGTLDPFATGLLVIAVGKATRLLPYIDGEPKVYETTIVFGAETDTDDGTGTVVREAPCPPEAVLTDPKSVELERAVSQLTGQIRQVPPSFSAKHIEGERAYDLARRGREVLLEAVPVSVHQWEWMAGTTSTLTVRITCGGGTYIRALARDLGRLLGSAAHCLTLRRIASGAARIEDAVGFASLAPGCVVDGAVPLVSPLRLLANMAHVSIGPDQVAALRVGRAIEATDPGDRAALLLEGEVVAIATRTDDARWQPRVVLLEPIP